MWPISGAIKSDSFSRPTLPVPRFEKMPGHSYLLLLFISHICSLFPLSCSFRKLKVLSEKPIEFTEVDLSPGDPTPRCLVFGRILQPCLLDGLAGGPRSGLEARGCHIWCHTCQLFLGAIWNGGRRAHTRCQASFPV